MESILYALAEGDGLYKSVDHGNTWDEYDMVCLGSLIMDKRVPGALYCGGHVWVNQDGIELDYGGVFSSNRGMSRTLRGLEHKAVTGLYQSGEGYRLYATTFCGPSTHVTGVCDPQEGGVWVSLMHYCDAPITVFDMNLDGDELPDACDDDDDNDGVHDDHDCDQFNPLLTWDTDGDKVCERPTWTVSEHNNCHAQCGLVLQYLLDRYGQVPLEWNSYLNGCSARCDALPDNCYDNPAAFTTTACQTVYEHLLTGAAMDQSDLAQVEAFERCRDLFFNPSQASENPSLLGDKCATYVLDLQADQGQCGATTATVSFRANAAPPTSALPMEGTSVEWCKCERPLVDLDWDPNCYIINCDRYSRDRWNPVRSTSFGSQNYDYPPSSTDPFAKQIYTIQHEMGRDRRFEFRRDPAANRHTFSWSWQATKLYPYGHDFSGGFPSIVPTDAELETTPQLARPLKVRVPWNPTVIEHPGEFPPGQAVLSDGVFYLKDASACPALAQDYPGRFDWFWWLLPGPMAEPQLDYFRDPSPLGWAAVEDPAGLLRLVSFDRSLATPQTAREITYLPWGTDTVDLRGKSFCAGRLDSALVGRSYGKVDAVFARGVPVGDLRPRLWIGLVGSPDNLWMTAQQAFGMHEEPRVGSPMFFDEERQTLFVLGDRILGPDKVEHNNLTALDFKTGLWNDWGHVEALGDATHLSVSFDPVRRSFIAFGGSEDGQATQRVVEVSIEGLVARALWAGGGTTPELSRASHGAYYDPHGQVLYVYGGERDGVPLGDAHAFDVRRRSWTALWTAPTGGPGPRIAPKVVYERRRNRLWVAGGELEPVEPVLAPWELDLDRGVWQRRVSLSGQPPAEPGLQSRTFSTDTPLQLAVSIDSAAPLQGEVRLLELKSDEPGLIFEVADLEGNPVASDERGGTDLQVVLLGQPGQRYVARVEAGPGYPEDLTTAVTFRDREAALVRASSVNGLHGVTSLAMIGSTAFVGHSTAVAVLDLADPEHPTQLA
ncbi:MAG: kelch repeat-containing protein, partial [bacterium]